MKVAKLCTQRVVSAPASSSLAEVVALMYGERVGCVVVTRLSEGKPRVVGVITDRDIVRAQLSRVADHSQLSLADTMTLDPLVVCEDDDTTSVLQRLRSRGVRRAPVVDRAGTLIGLISVDDLLQLVAREVADLAAVVATGSGPLS